MQSFVSFYYDQQVDEVINFLKTYGWVCHEIEYEEPKSFNSPDLFLVQHAQRLKLEQGSSAEFEIAELMELCGWICTKVNYDNILDAWDVADSMFSLLLGS